MDYSKVINHEYMTFTRQNRDFVHTIEWREVEYRQHDFVRIYDDQPSKPDQYVYIPTTAFDPFRSDIEWLIKTFENYRVFKEPSILTKVGVTLDTFDPYRVEKNPWPLKKKNHKVVAAHIFMDDLFNFLIEYQGNVLKRTPSWAKTP